MQIQSDFGLIEIVNELAYVFGSSDNSRSYFFSKHLDNEYGPTSIHGILLNGDPIAVFGDAGGCSGIHKHSALLFGGFMFLAVGRHVVCIRPAPFEYLWALKTDLATCFGIHYSQQNRALISHGELEIARFTERGNLLWATSGKDIFSEGILLLPQFIEARDFNQELYRIDYTNGALQIA